MRCVSAAAAAAGDGGGGAGLPDKLYNDVMLFEPNAVEIAMTDLSRVLRAEARHASKMRKRGAETTRRHSCHLFLFLIPSCSAVTFMCVKAAFHDTDTDILADILARIVAWMSACRASRVSVVECGLYAFQQSCP